MAPRPFPFRILAGDIPVFDSRRQIHGQSMILYIQANVKQHHNFSATLLVNLRNSIWCEWK